MDNLGEYSKAVVRGIGIGQDRGELSLARVDQQLLNEIRPLGPLLSELEGEKKYLGINEVDLVNSQKPESITGNLADCIFTVIRVGDERALTIHVAGYGPSYLYQEDGTSLLKKIFLLLNDPDPTTVRLRFSAGKNFDRERFSQLLSAAKSLGIPAENIAEIDASDENIQSIVGYNFVSDAFFHPKLSSIELADLNNAAIFNKRDQRAKEGYKLTLATTPVNI